MSKADAIPDDVLSIAEDRYLDAIVMTAEDEPKAIVLMIARAILAERARADSLSAHLDEALGALEWYAEQVAGCRKITSEGDAARHALDKDGGKRAREAIKASPTSPNKGEDE